MRHGGRLRGALLSVVALTAGLLGGAAATAPQAGAVTAPVAFSADNLSTWQTNGIVWALARSGSTVFAGGTFSAIRPPGVAAGGTGTRSAVNFAAFNAATGVPTSCALSFTRTSGTATVRALAVSPDGATLYAGGYFTSVGSVAVNGLAAIDVATCTARAAFNPAFNATVRALDVAADGTVYAGGDFTTVRGTARQRFAALTPAGALTSWTANADLSGRAVKVTTDGQHVVLGGDFTTVGGENSHALAVVASGTGAVEHTYPTGFIPANANIKALVTDGTGVYAASEGMGGASFDGRLALDTSDWSQRWRDTCQGANQALVVYQTVLYSGNHSHDCSSMGWFANVERKHFIAETTADSVPTPLAWAPDTNEGTGEQLGPRALTLASSGSSPFLWAAGEFTTVNGAAQQSLTRFGTTDTGAPSTPAVWASADTSGAVDVRWQASQDLDDGNLTYAVYRNGSTTPIHTETDYSLPWERPQFSWTDTSVTAGTTYSYRITASDGTGTSALSTARTATAASSADAYAARVRADGAGLYWRYDESSGTFASDSSGNDVGGAYVSTPSYRQTPAAVPGSSTALGLNGTSEYVYTEQRQPAPAAYSEETWIRTTTTSGGRILGFGDNIGTGDYASRSSDRVLYMTDAGLLTFGSGNSRAGTQATLTTPRAYNDGAWHHVVATQGAGGMALYVDGEPVGSNTNTNSATASGYWRVGGDSLSGFPAVPTSSFFAGTVDETAVYPTVLSAAQVAAHHTLGTATGGGGGGSSTVTLTATEDSYVNAGATGTNYGTSTSLAVRGSGAYVSYLRFQLPAAPSGTTLTGAQLRLRTTSLDSAGSADSFTVVPVTGTWTEAGVTYANRPALSSTVLGTLAAPNAVSTDYSVALGADGLSALLGSASSLALTSTGTDALWLWSGEIGTADYRPRLVLTFSSD
ncbi:LamG-like jellyroll fold domain-containing protein [Streptomyces sp. NPDC008150]|uniref:CBM96 family carbohydrate-binding protein n=1 Tax=Streptomyces sp. NPDC008150 TaxID=3364816 RepID=UPI0036E99240